MALRLAASHDEAEDGALVPFYLMRTLGGSRTVRAFDDLRFRDVNQILTQVEYRWEATPGLELALFRDDGKVFDEDGDFDFQDLVHAWGGGIRARSMWKTLMRLDVGHGDQGTFVYFRFGPSF